MLWPPHVYVLCLVASTPTDACLPSPRPAQEQLLPYLVSVQLRPPASLLAAVAEDAQAAQQGGGGGGGGLGRQQSSVMSLSALDHTSSGEWGLGGSLMRDWGGGGGTTASREWYCGAYIAPEGGYCQRANSLASYADVNRDVLSPEHAAALLREPPNPRNENYLHPSVTLGAKATVGAGCMVGEGSAIGDRTSVKRSVLGPGCQVGSNVKVGGGPVGAVGACGGCCVVLAFRVGSLQHGAGPLAPRERLPAASASLPSPDLCLTPPRPCPAPYITPPKPSKTTQPTATNRS